MKKKDVPQDKGLMDGRFEDVCYALDEKGNYVQVLSAGWEPKNEAMRQAWEEIHASVEKARQEVISGKYSPVYYFMIMNMMEIKLLAGYMEIPKRKVRKHLRPKHFILLDAGTLTRYADVFNITMDRLVHFNEQELKHEEG